MDESHKQRTLRGINWNFLRVFCQTFLGLLAGVVLARLLPPSDFGLLAIAMVFIGFADLVCALGMGPAIIRLEALQNSQIRVATLLSLLTGSLLVALLWAIAQTVADYFAESRVADVLRVLSFGLWFSALSAVSRGLLMRRLDFRRLFMVDMAAYLLGYAGVGISLAVAGFGVWSLVMGSVTSMLLSALSLLYLLPPKFTLALSRREVKEPRLERRRTRRSDETLTLSKRLKDLLGFGSGVSLNQTINYFAANVDYLIVGKFLNPTLLGLYSRSYQLVTLPLSKIATTLSAVMFPSYAAIQGDRAKLKRAYLMAVNVIALVTFPILAGLAMGAEFVIVGLYGENWRGAIEVLRILSIAGMLKAVFHVAGPVTQATGHVYAEVRRQIFYLLVLTIGCLGLVSYGIAAVGWAVVIGSLWLYLSMAQLAGRILGSSWKEFFSAQVPGVAVAVAVALAQYLIMTLLRRIELRAAPFVLVILVTVSAITFVLCFFYLPRRIIGEMPAWLILNYARHTPQPIRGWLLRRFS